MNTVSSNSSDAKSPDAKSRSRWLNRLVFLILLLVVALIAVLWLRVDRIGKEAVQRADTLAARTQALESQSKLLQDAARELTTRSTALESRLTEAAGQQAQLEKMYSNRSNDEVDSLLADIEQSVAIANQQLLVSGQVTSALLLLQEADRSAVRSKNPSLLVVHRLLSRDVERLKALPAIDTLQLASRLDAVSISVDQMPLTSDINMQVAGAGISKQIITSQKKSEAAEPSPLTDRWMSELQQLFRVRKIEQADGLLISPEQAFFVRQNFKLTLSAARVALVSRNDSLFKSDINNAQRNLRLYFDPRHPKVMASQASLEQLANTKIAVELPSLSETLVAVRSARSQR